MILCTAAGQWLDVRNTTEKTGFDWTLGVPLLGRAVTGYQEHLCTGSMGAMIGCQDRHCPAVTGCPHQMPGLNWMWLRCLGWFRIFQIFKAVKLTTLNGTAFWKHVAFVKMQQLHFFMWDKWSKMGKKWVHVWKKNYSWVSTTAAETVFNECVHLKMLWMC